jgi:glycosyltransferase involved in cell wall biosynthesis
MIKIASISNNYGKTFDGVGDFARVQNINYPKDINATVYSAECTYEASTLKRFFSIGMIQAIYKVIRDLKYSDYDVVMVEYPFVEWNPMILIPLTMLSKRIKKRGFFVLSLHEYNRVNYLRKKVIEKICKLSDLVFVSDENIEEAVKQYCKRTKIRQIPTNLYNDRAIHENIEKKENIYVYFGLVNSSKAFDEMLEAWDIFNREGDKKLYILSGTPLGDIERKHKGIEYIYNGSDYEIITKMREAQVCFLPVKPYVDSKNTTFKTASISGCICVGAFCDEYKKLDYVVNIENYNPKSIISALEKISNLSECEILKRIESAIEFGKKYTPQNTSEVVANEIRMMVGK